MTWQYLLLLLMMNLDFVVIAFGFYFIAKEKVWHAAIAIIVAMALLFGAVQYFKHLIAIGVI